MFTFTRLLCGLSTLLKGFMAACAFWMGILPALLAMQTAVSRPAYAQAASPVLCAATSVFASTSLANESFTGTAPYRLEIGDELRAFLSGAPGSSIFIGLNGTQIVDAVLDATGSLNVSFPVTSQIEGNFAFIFQNTQPGSTVSASVSCIPGIVGGGGGAAAGRNISGKAAASQIAGAIPALVPSTLNNNVFGDFNIPTDDQSPFQPAFLDVSPASDDFPVGAPEEASDDNTQNAGEGASIIAPPQSQSPVPPPGVPLSPPATPREQVLEVDNETECEKCEREFEQLILQEAIKDGDVRFLKEQREKILFEPENLQKSDAIRLLNAGGPDLTPEKIRELAIQAGLSEKEFETAFKLSSAIASTGDKQAIATDLKELERQAADSLIFKEKDLQRLQDSLESLDSEESLLDERNQIIADINKFRAENPDLKGLNPNGLSAEQSSLKEKISALRFELVSIDLVGQQIKALQQNLDDSFASLFTSTAIGIGVTTAVAVVGPAVGITGLTLQLTAVTTGGVAAFANATIRFLNQGSLETPEGRVLGEIGELKKRLNTIDGFAELNGKLRDVGQKISDRNAIEALINESEESVKAAQERLDAIKKNTPAIQSEIKQTQATRTIAALAQNKFKDAFGLKQLEKDIDEATKLLDEVRAKRIEKGKEMLEKCQSESAFFQGTSTGRSIANTTAFAPHQSQSINSTSRVLSPTKQAQSVFPTRSAREKSRQANTPNANTVTALGYSPRQVKVKNGVTAISERAFNARFDLRQWRKTRKQKFGLATSFAERFGPAAEDAAPLFDLPGIFGDERFNLFGAANVSIGQSGNGSQDSLSFALSGGASWWLHPGWNIGVAGRYQNADIDSSVSEIDANTWGVAAFLQTQIKNKIAPINLEGVIAYNHSVLDSTFNNLGAITTGEGVTNVVSGQLKASTAFKLDQFTLNPFFSLAYSSIDQESFTLSDGQIAPGSTRDQLGFSAGSSLSRSIALNDGDIILSPSLGLGAFGSFAGGDNIGLSANGSLGIRTKRGVSAGLGVGYSGRAGSAHNLSFSGNLSIPLN